MLMFILLKNKLNSYLEYLILVMISNMGQACIELLGRRTTVSKMPGYMVMITLG